MTFSDPTLTLLSRLGITPFESFVATIFLFVGFVSDRLNNDNNNHNYNNRKSASRPVSNDVVRTPESAFRNVRVPFHSRYFEFRFTDAAIHDKTFRVHYLDEGDPSSHEVILCLHGLPFW